MKIAVLGTSGSGKSTLCQKVSHTLGIPYSETDSMHWRAGWQTNPHFEQEVKAFISQESWILEWQYDSVRPIIAEEAEFFIFLDYPRWFTTYRVTKRTLQRRFNNQPICNGNTEGSLTEFFTDSDHIIRWSWKSHKTHRNRWDELQHTYPEKQFLRFTSPKQTRTWLNEVTTNQRIEV